MSVNKRTMQNIWEGVAALPQGGWFLVSRVLQSCVDSGLELVESAPHLVGNDSRCRQQVSAFIRCFSLKPPRTSLNRAELYCGLFTYLGIH